MFNLIKQILDMLVNDERGDFSVKSLAVTVAAIVVIGFVIMEFTTGGWLMEVVQQVWDGVWGWISDLMG